MTRLDATSFARHLDQTRLLAPQQRVIVALSGGRDSVALLHLLVRLRAEWDLDVRAAHLDHRMRAGSAADAAWVAGLCRAWSVELVTACAREVPRSEADARALRYAFLRSVMKTCAAHAVATAHHRDDQAETVLMRIARGTGVRGLRGIAARRGRLVRPLLAFERSAIDDYVAREGIAWREDPSNADLRYARNRLRGTLMPALGGDAAGALAQLARAAGAVESSWRAATDELLRDAVPVEGGFLIARDALLGYDPAARARLVRALCRRLGVVPTRSATGAALALVEEGVSGHGIDLGGGLRFERGLGGFRLIRPAPAPPVDRPLRIDVDEGSGSAVVGGRTVRVEWRPASANGKGEPARGDWNETTVAASRLPLELRGWQPGDRIRLAAGSRKLKKLFNDWRVERPERGRLPVLADASGRILWIAGRAAAVDAATAGEPHLRISVRDAELE